MSRVGLEMFYYQVFNLIRKKRAVFHFLPFHGTLCRMLILRNAHVAMSTFRVKGATRGSLIVSEREPGKSFTWRWVVLCLSTDL